MKTEIERKFLLANDSWRIEAGAGMVCKQAYLVSTIDRSVRVRIIGEYAYITIKGTTGSSITRLEYEYEIPMTDAEIIFSTICQPGKIEKTRYEIRVGDHTWEIDEFHGDNTGLVVAEIELNSEDEYFIKPNWIGTEVSYDTKYLNSRLIKEPFKDWN